MKDWIERKKERARDRMGDETVMALGERKEETNWLKLWRFHQRRDGVERLGERGEVLKVSWGLTPTII
jgi:hypothetical protein